MSNFLVNISEGAYDKVKDALAAVGHALEPVETEVVTAVQSEIPVVTAWAAQFLTDEGKVILADAETYGPQIIAGTITIAGAAAKLEADLIAKGLQDLDKLKDTLFNALRTQANAAVSSVS